MVEFKRKITINDLRVDKGGDPELYRRVLSLQSSKKQLQSQKEQDDTPDDLITQALFMDDGRRTTTTRLESLRAQSSNLQINTIAPKKKNGEDVGTEVAQLKEWKLEIGKLLKDVKEAEKKRNDILAIINTALEQIDESLIEGLKTNEVGNSIDTSQESTQSISDSSSNEGENKSADNVRDSGNNSTANNAHESQHDVCKVGASGPLNENRKSPAGNIDENIPTQSNTSPSSEVAQHQMDQTTNVPSQKIESSPVASKMKQTSTTTSLSKPTPKEPASSPKKSLPLLSPEHIKTIPPERILNLNVGVLGHVDTGKTSLVKTLSSVLSTAALDKSKQSRARGITLDLGFSAFLLPLPEHLKAENATSESESNDDGKTSVDANSSTANSTSDVGDSVDGIIDPNTNTNADSSMTMSQENSLHQKYDLLQVTLVDCPGHASLIRTIIGGAQIIDMVLLVVDATKGVQTQTAECLVIAEMTTRNLIVVLNKVDLFPENEREERIRLAEKKMRMALRGTKFENAKMVGISACVGGEKVAAVNGASGDGGVDKSGLTKGGGSSGSHTHSLSNSGSNGAGNGHLSGTNNIHGLLDLLQSQIRPPNRDSSQSPDKFHFAVDHCFPIKGQGTVLTGTCLSGSARPNDMVEFPTLATQKKIKGLQMFRRKANIIQQGDRAGICVSNFDSKLMERGIIAAPGTVKLIRGAIAVVRKVRFFKGGLHSGAKFHISVGHTTVMATVTFWGAREIALQLRKETQKEFLEQDNNSRNNESNSSSHKSKKSSAGVLKLGKSSLGGSADLAGLPRLDFDWNQDFVHQDNYIDSIPSNDEVSQWSSSPKAPMSSRNKKTPGAKFQEGKQGNHQKKAEEKTLPPLHWARLEFLTPVYCPMDSLVIGSRLDTEVNANACRLAFSGRLVERYDAKTDHGRLKTYTKKEKVGSVCRLGDQHRRNDDNKLVRYEVFGTDLFKKETNMTQFVGLLIETENGDVGSIQSSFGTSGKFRVHFPGGTEIKEGDPLYLRFKRYANDPKKAIHQDGVLSPARPGSRLEPPVKKKKKKGNNGAHQKVENSAHVGNGEKSAEKVSQINAAAKNVVRGEILKVKGDILENGKHSVAIVSGFFSMEDDISKHKGRKVVSKTTKEEGEVEGSFGKMGKCKVTFKDGISAEIGSHVELFDFHR